jgi:Cu(I)/Ag(I) efflux system membrane fusion protein
MQQNLGVRTAEVKLGSISPQLQVAGSISYNERDQALVQARASGYVERLLVRATLDRVVKGQPLIELHVPDWVGAQEEYLSVRSMKTIQGAELAVLVAAARQRMRHAGMTEDHIRAIETSGQVQSNITLTAPISGVVVELLAREGMTVMPGTPLFRINGLSSVWAMAEVPESQAALLRTRHPHAEGPH